jgi:hypothetical protein
MTVKDMHYDFKFKYNKVDSQSNRNFRIPEIDWFLNEAEDIFKKVVAFPRFATKLGLESSTRNTDSIRTIIKTEEIDNEGNQFFLPENYSYFVKATVQMSKGSCSKKGKFFVAKHDKQNEFSEYYSTSFDWGEVYGVFQENVIKVLEEPLTTVDKLNLTYIKKTAYIHNAEDFNVLGYSLPGGTVLTGFQNSELPEETHREIVDIAVALASGNLQSSDYNIRMNKLQINQLI